jgi:hypothetical protein
MNSTRWDQKVSRKHLQELHLTSSNEPVGDLRLTDGALSGSLNGRLKSENNQITKRKQPKRRWKKKIHLQNIATHKDRYCMNSYSLEKYQEFMLNSYNPTKTSSESLVGLLNHIISQLDFTPQQRTYWSSSRLRTIIKDTNFGKKLFLEFLKKLPSLNYEIHLLDNRWATVRRTPLIPNKVEIFL